MAEQAEAAPQQNEAVAHLKELVSLNISEDHGRVIFERYDASGSDTWSKADIRAFLLDVQEAFDSPRVVPNEAIEGAVKEIKLDVDSQDTVTWVEFKSYILYLQSKPLHRLHEIVDDQVPSEAVQNAVVVAGLASVATLESVLAEVSKAGPIAYAYFIGEPSPQVLVAFRTVEAQQAAVAMNGLVINGKKSAVHTLEEAKQFPLLVYKKDISAVSRGLASVYLTAGSVDDKLKISQTVKSASSAVSAKAGQISQDLKLKEKYENVSNQVSMATKSVDEKYKVSEKTSAATAKVSAVARKVAAVPAVQQVTNAFGSLFNVVSNKLGAIRDETKEVIDEEEAKKPAAAVAEDKPVEGATPESSQGTVVEDLPEGSSGAPVTPASDTTYEDDPYSLH